MTTDRSTNRGLRVAILGGSWSSNVGNAFYNLGAEWLLQQIASDVQFIPESPRWKEQCQGDFDFIGHLDCDLVLLVGPCLNLKLSDVYTESFQRLYDRGIKVGYLSVGMSIYDDGEADAVRRFFEQFPPAFIATRDDLTHEYFKSRVSCPTYSGLCTSLFLNDAYQPIDLARDPYVVFNFDSDEPALRIEADGTASIIAEEKSLFGRRKHEPPTHVHGQEIVRTCNLSIDDGYRQIYQRPNTYHSDLPWGYCSVLKNAQRVYSERVHTCAATLIYGSEAQFLAKSERSFEKRSLLFEQIGLRDIFSRPVRIDFDVLNPLKEKLTRFLREVVR